jgi:rhodanese-related sulfurtransferase
MNKRYYLLAGIMIILGVVLALLPEKQYYKQIKPVELLAEINDPARYVTTDQVAQKIIDQDPSIALVDVRSVIENEKFSLPNAINIPMSEILNEEYTDMLDPSTQDIIFFSNSDIYAEQAWIVAARYGFTNIYIMKGGLNRWVETIMKPEPPASTASTYEIDLYEFRRGACTYFGGGNTIIQADGSKAKPVVMKRRKKKSVAAGGC